MLASIDLANHEQTIRCYVAHSQDVVTVLFKFGETEVLDASCLKVRFTTEQFHAFQDAVAGAVDFPGIDLNGGGA